jgi:surface antigen
VKNLMALGKSLILMVTLGSLVGCASQPMQQSESIQRSAAVHNSGSGLGIFGVIYGMAKYDYFSLTRDQKQKQNAAVHAALESDYGVVYEWFDGDARGAVKAVHGYPIQSGTCRVIFSMIQVKGRERHFEETACMSTGHRGWRFIGK